KGHGLLTWAIRDAFRQEAGQDGFVGLLQLAEHIDRKVPIISQEAFGVSQHPFHKIEGNFPLGVRVADLPVEPDVQAIPTKPDYILRRPELARFKPAGDAPGLQLEEGQQVRVVEWVSDGDWALIARAGEKIGYVPASALLKMRP